MAKKTSEKSTYDPGHLLDSLQKQLKVDNDSGLSAALGISKPLISKIRNRHLSVSGAMLVRMHEVTGKSIQSLRKTLGCRRAKFRISEKEGLNSSNTLAK
ncbi:MAG: helix-turn-helix domain-containing protein [Janthinobacterium lividum]